MPSYAVIGASRGIGLEYVRQLASRSDAVVFAIVRNPEGSTHLKAVAASLQNVHILAGDVVDYSTLEQAAKQVSEITNGKLDCLIHNAAHMNAKTVHKGFDDYTNMEELDDEFITAFKVNSLGPIHSITAFLPLLRASDTKKIVVLGSGAGDLKAVQTFNMVNMAAYGMTKAAATIATTKFALKLKDEGFVVVTLTPGMVDTSATAGADRDVVTEGYAAFTASVKNASGVQLTPQTPEASIAAQLKLIDRLDASQNGLFLSHTGVEYGSTK
uniref:Isoepoxydon dehydrogenase patN (IDH) ) n=1 Tax=Ganoderma boninense TaxID=34458 RepID=A0A5K1JWS4_9APHY|nr:Isoepoxydon dehydrogenase patN (IDH) (EC (Patulin biosynthesis cluster protein N) [Ganoderma boninense]